jgi:hypothetical protein
MTSRHGLRGLFLLATVSVAVAATPPASVNYQGVLRDNQDKPVSGTFDMTFAFFDALAGGNQVLVDAHAAAGSGGVAVANGLFNALLGGGTVSDGSGPGIYADLAAVFRDYGGVWLEIKVGGETLAPRLKLQSSAYAMSATSATQLGGKPASSFIDTSSARQIKYGPFRLESADPTYAVLDVVASNSSPYVAWLEKGGYVCTVQDGTNGLYCTSPYYGMEGYGGTAGAFFQQNGSYNWGYIGYNGDGFYGNGYYSGVDTYGGSYGGYLRGGNTGVYASGNSYGVTAYGNTDGVYAQGNYGIYANGSYAGTYGVAGTYGAYGNAYIGVYGYGTYGVQGISFPNGFGGYFSDGDSYSYVGDHNSNGVYYKIWGNGTVSFVQNHPEASDKTINYAAPEGDEAAVYTRGKAHLTNGEAHVALGETFKWVVNPDIGLTATVTPRGEAAPLAVMAVTPSELVVRGPAGSNADFDYMVWGLRIGFERMTTVQPKHDYSPAPAVDSTADFYAKNPELQRFNALERFKAMEPEGKAPDLSRGKALLAAVNRFDPSVDGPLEEAKKAKAAPALAPVPAAPSDQRPAPPAPPLLGTAPASHQTALVTGGPVRADSPAGGGGGGGNGAPLQTLPVAETVEAGDVVAMDPADGGSVRPARMAGDRMVVGIAVSAVTDTGNSVPVAWAGVVACRVDAASGAIAAGDFLVASNTPGHAMRAPAVAAPGTIVAKALEAWSAGTGTIRVLVMTR